MILVGVQPSKVMQDFATIHSMFQPIPTIKNGHDITTENWNCSPWMQKACAQCAWATKSEVIWRAGQGKWPEKSYLFPGRVGRYVSCSPKACSDYVPNAITLESPAAPCCTQTTLLIYFSHFCTVRSNVNGTEIYFECKSKCSGLRCSELWTLAGTASTCFTSVLLLLFACVLQVPTKLSLRQERPVYV